MHKACYNDDVDGLRALVESLSKSEAETQIGQRDHHGWTALHVAIFMNHIEIINVLVSFSVCVINIPGRVFSKRNKLPSLHMFTNL